jgi:protein-tyrosine phosphatase
MERNVTTSDANQILPRLWLGNKTAALDSKWLRDKKITTVFNCTKDIPFGNGPLHQYRVPIDDSLRQEDIQKLTDWSPEIMYKLMAEYKQGATILVHCWAGVQRSAAVVAMFLMTLHHQPMSVVVPFMRHCRPIVFTPAMNFMQSIQTWEKTFFSYINRSQQRK